MKITHLLPLALAITSKAHLATTPTIALSLFQTRDSNDTSPSNPPQPNSPPQVPNINKTVLAERWSRRQARYRFTDEEVNLQSSARLYYATTPNLPSHIPNITPIKPNQSNIEVYNLYKQSLDALAHEKGKDPQEKQKAKEEREKSLAVFRIQNDCISALGHQKYCAGGVRELRKMGWEAYKKQFDDLYAELREGMRTAGLVGLGEMVDAWQREQERLVIEGDEKWRALREAHGNESMPVIDWAGFWNETRNWTAVDWIRGNLTGNWTGREWLRNWNEERKESELLHHLSGNSTDDSTDYPADDGTDDSDDTNED